jgi:hypothetical protein
VWKEEALEASTIFKFGNDVTAARDFHVKIPLNRLTQGLRFGEKLLTTHIMSRTGRQ